MAPKTRSKGQAFSSSNLKTQSDQRSQGPPEPFKRPPEHIEPFLSKLAKDHVYITHIDSNARDFKRKIFAVPFLMNVAISVLILWRIVSIGPFYVQIILSLAGQHNETTVDKSQLSYKQIFEAIFRRSGTFMLDFIIYAFVWSWPKEFFTGRVVGNPIAWRFGVGFRDKEIIVRRSKKWDRTLEDPVVPNGPGQQLLFPIIWKAVDPTYMKEKTGYLMLNNEWDLDWNSILAATELVDAKKLSVDDFKTTIYVHSQQYGWLILETAAAGGSAKEEEGRRKIVAFKDELTAMGKENLFFKWIELVQFESTQPGGFGPEQQAMTMEKAKALFEAQGVDFDAFWKKIGGMDGMPGMD